MAQTCFTYWIWKGSNFLCLPPPLYFCCWRQENCFSVTCIDWVLTQKFPLCVWLCTGMLLLGCLWRWWLACCLDLGPLGFIQRFDDALNGTWCFVRVQESSLLFNSFAVSDFGVGEIRVYPPGIHLLVQIHLHLKIILSPTWEHILRRPY